MTSKCPFSDDVRAMLLDAISRLVNLRETTPRFWLRQKLKGKPEILDRLLVERYLIEREKDKYVPGIMAFETCGDDSALRFAKNGAGIVLHTLQNLYAVGAYQSPPQTSFTVTEIKEQAKRLFTVIEAEKFPLGLSLVAESEINMLAGWDPNGGSIAKVHVREDIVDYQNVEQFWNQVVQQRLALASRNEKKVPPDSISPVSREAPYLLDLSFMQDGRLRLITERDYAELRALNGGKARKSMLIIAGGIVEGLLLDALITSGKWSLEEGCQKNLQDMIAAAKNSGIITEDRLSDALRKYRTLVHPGREIRDRMAFTEADATLARAAVDVVIQDVRRWYSARGR